MFSMDEESRKKQNTVSFITKSEGAVNTTLVYPVTQKLSNLLTSQDMSDITVTVGKEPHSKSFKLHKVLLGLFSEVFHAMFFGSMAEVENEVKLPEDDAVAFEAVIKYIYTGTVQLDTAKMAVSVYCLSDKYLLKELKEQCTNYLIQNINVETAIDVYEMAAATLEHKLEAASWRYIKQHSLQIFQQISFRNAQLSTVQKMLQEEGLMVQTELQVYEAVLLWGKEQCKTQELMATPFNIRLSIETLLPEIRFLSMTAVQFVQSPGRDNILTESEQLMILKNILVPGACELPPTCNINRTVRSQNSVSAIHTMFGVQTDSKGEQFIFGGSSEKFRFGSK